MRSLNGFLVSLSGFLLFLTIVAQAVTPSSSGDPGIQAPLAGRGEVSGADEVYLLGSGVFPGDFYDICYLNGYLWMADGEQVYSGNLKVLDVSDPENPVVIASDSYPGYRAFRLEGDGDRMYVSIVDWGVVIYDATDPANPAVLGTYATAETVNDMDVLGDLLCMLEDNGGFIIADASDPQNIQVLSQTTTPGNRYSVAVTSDSLLMIAAGAEGLLFYSIGDPYNPRYLDKVELNSKGFQDVVCDDEYAYAVYRSTIMNTGGFAVVDLTDPPNFSILSQNGAFGVEPFPQCGLALAGDTLFFAADQGGFGVWDVSNPENPLRWGGFGGAWLPPTLVRWSMRAAYGGGYAYNISPNRFDLAASRGEACVVDLSDLSDPYPVGVYDPPDYLHEVVAAGDYAYLAANNDELIVVDVSDPSSPEITGEMPEVTSYFRGVDLFYEDSLVFMTGGQEALAVISVSDPHNPALEWEMVYPYGGAPQHSGIDKEEDLLAVSGYANAPPAPPGWFWLFDVSDPTFPSQLSYTSFDVRVISVDIVDTIAYLGASGGYTGTSGGLMIYDISNPSIPAFISLTTTGGGVHDVVVRDGIAYAADALNGLVIYSVNDPYSPVHLADLPLPDLPLDLELSGDSLYIAASGEMLVVDISNLSAPFIVDEVTVEGTAEGLFLDQGRIYLTDYYGMHIYSYEWLGLTEINPVIKLPEHYNLDAYPNPFNPSTTIRYQLPADSFAQLEVYDLTGKKVAQLVNGRRRAGDYQVTFDGSNAASGIYIARLHAGDFQATEKLVLVK